MKLLLALTLLPVLASVGAADWFVSNAVGITGQPISADEAEEHDYVLQVERRDGGEVRTLFHDGGEVQRVEVTRQGPSTVERTFRDGVLENETEERDDGRPLSERLYADGALTESREYTYENDRLARLTVRDGDGEPLYAETYEYWSNGTLRSIVKEEQDSVLTEYRYSDGRLREEWISRPGESERFRFDAAGRLVIRERFAGDELLEQEVRQYWDASGEALIKEVVIRRLDAPDTAEQMTRRGYDERGRLVSERVERDGALERELSRGFEGDFLAAEIETSRDGVRRWDYTYTDEGEQATVSFREGGQLVEVRHLALGPEDAPADRMTELYRRGEPILRVYYAGQQRVREDVIRDGQVIQRREFPPPGGGDG